VYRYLTSLLLIALLLPTLLQAQETASRRTRPRSAAPATPPLPAPVPAAVATASAPPAPLPALSVVSIIPAQGEPGMTITMNGTGFTPATRVYLGTRELPVTVMGSRMLTAELPELPNGVYALYVRREDGTASRAYNFMLQPQKPIASALSPDTVTTCATGAEREVVITGANFLAGSRIIFDGAALTTRFISPAQLSFIAPRITSGLHQVQVKNPSEAMSGTLALFLDSKPEITNAAIGVEAVSHYELVVMGRNFQQSSILVADGKRILTEQRIAGEREQLVFVNCNQLIYLRNPYDPTPKVIRLQVVNQNGEESSVFTINAP
jgi:hypothetical protein